VDYFSRLGYVCPTYTNPADFLFMNILNVQKDDDIAHLVAANSAKLAPATTNGVKVNGKSESDEGRKEEEDRVQGLLQSWKVRLTLRAVSNASVV
jgi:hypothetical protein